jgi:hypothetical protein
MGSLQTMLIGRVLTDGRLNARVKCDLTDDLALKANAQVKYLLISPYLWTSFLPYPCFFVFCFFWVMWAKFMDKHVSFLTSVIFFLCSSQTSLTCLMSCWTLITRWSSLYHVNVHISFHIHSPSQTMKVGMADIFVTSSICISVKHLKDEMIMLFSLFIMIWFTSYRVKTTGASCN